MRTENLKEGKSRQDMFAAQGAVVNSSMPQSAVSGFHSGSVLAAADDDAQVGFKLPFICKVRQFHGEYRVEVTCAVWTHTWIELVSI